MAHQIQIINHQHSISQEHKVVKNNQNDTSSEGKQSVKELVSESNLTATHALDSFNPLKDFHIQIKQQQAKQL